MFNWEKCHFIVKESIVLGHRISEKGIEVDQYKDEVIERLPPPISIKDMRCFLGMRNSTGGLLRISQKLDILCASYLRNVNSILMNPV